MAPSITAVKNNGGYKYGGFRKIHHILMVTFFVCSVNFSAQYVVFSYLLSEKFASACWFLPVELYQKEN